jgi:hypothetical protein
MTEVFRGFPQFLQANAGIVGAYLKLGHDRFLSHPFQFIIHPIIRRLYSQSY